MTAVVFKIIWIALVSITLLASFSRLPMGELASHLRMYYAVLLPICFFVALLRKSNIAALIIGMVALINLQPILTLYSKAGLNQSLNFQIPIKVLEYNPCAYENHQYQKFFDLAKKENPDLIVVAELDQGWYDNLKTAMPKLGFAFNCISFHDNCGMAVFSQFPIKESKETIVQSKLKHPYLELEFDTPTRFKLMAVHASTPEYLNERNDEFSTLANIARKTTCPVIMAGDFNCSPWSDDFLQIMRQGKVHNASQSFGPNCTWNARWIVPMVPIDHFFCGDQIKTTNVRTADDIGSDHLPLIGEFELP